LLDFTIAGLISRAIVLLVAVVVHEFAHGYVAHLMGDDTAKNAGRMTLDPRANVYWPGYFIGVIIGFAILGSAPVNPYRMRNRRLGMALAVLAGPVSNLLIAIVFAIPFILGLMVPVKTDIAGILPTPTYVFVDMVFLNVLLFVFNLLPLAPLDGWTITLSVLPPRAAIWWERNRMNSQYVLFALIGISFIMPYLVAITPLFSYLNILDLIISGPTMRIVRLLLL
jgi:Zn-dependent protease